MRILKGLPRVIRELDVPESQRTCTCCGEGMRPFGVERSEHLHYVPAVIQIVNPARHGTVKARLWVYARGGRGHW